MLTYKEFETSIQEKLLTLDRGGRGLDTSKASVLAEVIDSILDYVKENKELTKAQTLKLMEIGKQTAVVQFSVKFDLAFRA